MHSRIQMTWIIPFQAEPATVHHLLLEKTATDASIWLSGASKVKGSNNVEIALAKRHATVSVYDVTVGTTPVHVYSNVDSVPLVMSDHAMIVEIIN